jgi:hypothetical protein
MAQILFIFLLFYNDVFRIHFSQFICGILLLSLEDATGPEKQQVIAKILEKYADKMINNFCVYQNKKFRFRKLSRAK